MSAREAVRNLFGSEVVCTLDDGRRVRGTLVCVDRLKNIILSDCTETRVLVSTDYYCCCNNNDDDDSPEEAVVTRTVTRFLQHAMVPGNHLRQVKVARNVYEAKVAPLL